MELGDRQIRAALHPFGVPVDSALAEAIRRYLALLLLWNRKINLTSITDPGEILTRHFGESMFAAHAVPITTGALVDVGSGGGFPGLALKLVRPALSVRLIEPVRKKAVFLAEAARALNLTSIEVLTKRTDELAPADLRANYVTARGVGDFEALVQWAHAALTNQGQIALWLGEEDAAIVGTWEGWSWGRPIQIPLSERRFLLVGRRAP